MSCFLLKMVLSQFCLLVCFFPHYINFAIEVCKIYRITAQLILKPSEHHLCQVQKHKNPPWLVMFHSGRAAIFTIACDNLKTTDIWKLGEGVGWEQFYGIVSNRCSNKYAMCTLSGIICMIYVYVYIYRYIISTSFYIYIIKGITIYHWSPLYLTISTFIFGPMMYLIKQPTCASCAHSGWPPIPPPTNNQMITCVFFVRFGQ